MLLEFEQLLLEAMKAFEVDFEILLTYKTWDSSGIASSVSR